METLHYSLDENHTTIGFAARHMLVSTVRGRFNSCHAELSFDLDDFTQSSIEMRIDTASVDTGVATRDADLRSAEFFDVERYPTLTFVSRKIERLYPAHFRATGALTIKGVTREVAIEVEFGGVTRERSGSTRIGFHAQGTINRRDFGLVWDELLETGGLLIGEYVSIDIDAEALSAGVQAAA